MAHPIEPTPTLKGKDADYFYKELTRKKTAEEIEQRRKIFDAADRIYKMIWKPYFRKMIDSEDE